MPLNSTSVNPCCLSSKACPWATAIVPDPWSAYSATAVDDGGGGETDRPMPAPSPSPRAKAMIAAAATAERTPAPVQMRPSCGVGRRRTLVRWGIARAGGREAAAAARICSRNLVGGVSASTANGIALTARSRRRTVAVQLAQPGRWARTISSSSASVAPSTNAPSRLSISSCSRSGLIPKSFPLEIRMQLLQGESDSSFDRAQGHARDLGDLAVRVAAVEGELDRLLLVDRQARDGFAHGVALHRGRDRNPGIALRSGGGERLDDVEPDLPPLLRAAPPQLVDRAVAHRGHEPGAQRTPARVKGRGVVPELDERLLDDVLRQSRVAQDAERDAIGQRAVAVVEQRERVDVGRRERAAELGVSSAGAKACQHRMFYTKPSSRWRGELPDGGGSADHGDRRCRAD